MSKLCSVYFLTLLWVGLLCGIVVFPDYTACMGPGNIVGGPSTTSCFSPQLNIQKSNGFFLNKTIIFKDPKGVHFFQGGVQLLIPYKNPNNL